jgi:hypothetical protein
LGSLGNGDTGHGKIVRLVALLISSATVFAVTILPYKYVRSGWLDEQICAVKYSRNSHAVCVRLFCVLDSHISYLRHLW